MQNLQSAPKSIIIVGGGTAGWMSASLMMQAWHDKGTKITLIESAAIEAIGVGEGSTPSLRLFFKQLGIPDSEWMPQCNATYKCGISFPNWSVKPGFESYFHPFYSKLDWDNGNAFMHNARLRRSGYDVPAHPDSFWSMTRLSEQKKSPITAAQLIHDADFGYHFDSALLGQFLKKRAIKNGITHINDTIIGANKDHLGNISNLSTKNSGKLSAELFIDCTGFSGLLIRKALNVPFFSYSDVLLNDRAVAIPSAIDNTSTVVSHTRSEALTSGWAWSIPLANRYGNGYVYSSKYLTEDEAEKELRQHIGPSCEGMKSKHIKMQIGSIKEHWCKNVLAVGLSQGFIEPLEATALMLVQFTIDRFIVDYEKTKRCGISTDKHRDFFNTKVNENFSGIKDYIAAHYFLNSRTDSSYWIDNRNNPNHSERLQKLIKAWDQGLDFEAALTAQGAEFVYPAPSWYCLFAGKGRFPQKLSPPRAGVTPAALKDIEKRRDSITQKFKDHREVLVNNYGEKWPT